MVVAEVPLWVSHGNNASAAAARALPGAGIAGLPSKPNGSSSLPAAAAAAAKHSRAAADRSAARAALSLLSSTRGGSQRAPMYSVDVHPDGTRFATAAGDGTVKIWSVGCLFASGPTEGDGQGKDGEAKKKKRRGTSRFTESGNYVSSSSEYYYQSDSSSEEMGGRSSGQRQHPPAAPQQLGVNDLSGLVRKKKDAGKAPGAVAANSFAANGTTNTTSNNNKEGPSSPLSRLSSAPANNAGRGSGPNSGDKSKRQHRLLSTISSHEGSVLSLRFSPSGAYLATTGDDSYVNIFVRSNSPSLAKGNLVGVGADGRGGNANGGSDGDIEHWNRVAICRGHHLDVVGVAWAPDDSHLVSCSLDSANPIIVWRLYNVLDADPYPNGGGGGGPIAGGIGSPNKSSVHIHNLHPFKILGRGIHTSMVKGVAFDPAGKYVATSGDDPAVCIWRASGDWGLEARVDASNSSVFRGRKRRARGGGAANGEDEEDRDDPGELASLSLFRRISFAPDGSHVCGTNATLRGKNVAAMIGREGWAATGSGGDAAAGTGGDASPPGAANLVGHKQPVLASRYCPVFFCAPGKTRKRGGGGGDSSSPPSSSSEEESEEDDDVEYATLVALGDKRGFVTVWSTKSSRPIFKMQCSESRCTVTDISWGLVRNSNSKGDERLVMIVSLLDGYVVALHFDIPTEVGGGQILSDEKTCRLFRAKYGIDDFVGNYGVSPGLNPRRKRLVDDAGPMLIENALQLTMEMEAEKKDEGDSDSDVESEDGKSSGEKGGDADKGGENHQGPSLNKGITLATSGIKDKQVESTKSGKRRIRPVLMNANNNDVAGGAATSVSDDAGGAEKETVKKKRHKKNKDEQQPSNLLQNALDAASQAASVAEGVSIHKDRTGGAESGVALGAEIQENNVAHPSSKVPTESHSTASASLGSALRIPYTTNKIFSLELATPASSSTTLLSPPALNNDSGEKIVADCTNSVGGGVSFSADNASSSWPNATVTISRGGVRSWRDIILRAKCTALAANEQVLVVGTADGCLYLYRTSPTLGWKSGKAFRAHPPYIFGSPIVEISISSSTLLDRTSVPGDTSSERRPCPCELVVVASDGNFYVYSLLPSGLKLHYKGSIVPAMQHMSMSLSSISQSSPSHRAQPKMARIQITDLKQLMLILVLLPTKPSSSTGRVLQSSGFIFDRDMELWMRISDSKNFLLSDLYPSFPTGHDNAPHGREGQDHYGVGILATMDRLVKSGASTMASARQMYQKVAGNSHHNDTTNSTSEKVFIRSYCEDRLACAIALQSTSELQTWLKYYVRCLSSGSGDEDALRFLVDILIGGRQFSSGNHDPGSDRKGAIPPILSMVGDIQCLGLVGKDVISKAILPEMSKNRLLQRLTNEISMELECL